MSFIIVFLGIIAIADVVSTICNIKSNTAQKSVDILTRQLERERDAYATYREQSDKAILDQKDAANLWAKKYFELEILLKKYEAGAIKEDKK